jgi:hypothetical protein
MAGDDREVDLMLGDFPRAVSAAGVKASKLDGVLRYWPKQGGSSVVVGLSKAEIDGLLAGGVPFATIYEAGSASWMSGGHAAGVQAANWLKSLFASTGYTPPCVYLAADSNTLTTAAVNACLDGFASILGREMTALYGYLPYLESARSGGHATRYWLTGRYVSPSAYPWISLYQCQGSQPSQYPTTVIVSGQTGDGDIALQADWGQSGVDVALTQADLDLLFGDARFAALAARAQALSKGTDNAVWAGSKPGSEDSLGGRALGTKLDSIGAKIDALSAEVSALKLGQTPSGTYPVTGTVTIGQQADSFPMEDES